MADGISSLAPLSWGTSSAGSAVSSESTLSMGVDRGDTRIPPDTNHVWGAQVNACKNLLISISQTFKSGTRLGLSTQSSSPFGVAEQGFWCDTSGNPKFSYGGAANTLLAPAFANKGDLVTYTGSAVTTLSGSGVTNGWVLTFDSTQPGGIKWAAGGSTSTGNWTFSGNNLDISVAGTMALGTGNSNTTSMTFGSSSTGPVLFNGTRLRFQQAAQSGVTALSALSVIGGAHTTMTASTEYLAENHQLNQTYQWATGALTTQRHVLFQAPTYSFVGASTITTAATLAISGAPVAGTNATITNPYALWLQGGNLGMAANTSIANSSQGSTNTTGVTVAGNVADGASSVGVAINASTALTSGKLLSIQSAGSEKWSFADDGSILGYLRSTRNRFQLLSANSYGIYADGDGAQVSIMTAGNGRVIISNSAMTSDGIATLGSSGTPWPSSFTSRPVVANQVIAAAGTISVNPASGDYVRINLGSTAITSMTLQAGVNGEEMVVEVVQDATGSRSIPTTWTNVAFAGGTYTATATANKHDCISFIYNSTLSKWLETGRALNMS